MDDSLPKELVEEILTRLPSASLVNIASAAMTNREDTIWNNKLAELGWPRVAAPQGFYFIISSGLDSISQFVAAVNNGIVAHAQLIWERRDKDDYSYGNLARIDGMKLTPEMEKYVISVLSNMAYDDAQLIIGIGANAPLVLEAFAYHPDIVTDVEACLSYAPEDVAYVKRFYETAARLGLELHATSHAYTHNFGVILLAYPEWFKFPNAYSGGHAIKVAPKVIAKLQELVAEDFDKYAGAYIVALSNNLYVGVIRIFAMKYVKKIAANTDVLKLLCNELSWLRDSEGRDISIVVSILLAEPSVDTDIVRDFIV